MYRRIRLLCIAVMLTLLLSGCEYDARADAYSVAQGFVKNKLSVPDSAKFEKYEEHFVQCNPPFCLVSSSVSHKNSNGIRVVSDFQVMLEMSEDEESWYLNGIDISQRN